jgi:type IV pilus assembly protein PilA
MLKKYLENDKGLTLVELLAVIVILGIIAAISVPSIGGIIEKSRADAVKAEGIQVLNAAKLYIASEGAPSTKLTSQELSEYISENDDVWTKDYSVKVTGTDTITLNGTGEKGNVKIIFKNATIKGINDFESESGTIDE